MRVKDLIKALEKANQEAEVFVEVNGEPNFDPTPQAHVVNQYEFENGEINVYIANNTEYLDEINERGEYVIWRDLIKKSEIYKEVYA